MDLEEAVMGLIINAGQAKSCAMEALQKAKSGDWQSADRLITESKEMISLAHAIQTKLISEDEGTGKISVHLIMVHAQDHLMTAMLAEELIEELIILHKKLVP